MVDKLVRRDRLNDREKHNVESPFFAAGRVQAALEGRGISSIWGISEFASEHKERLSSDRHTACFQIESILKSQRWYLVCEKPFSPMFPKSESSRPQGIVFGAPRTQSEPVQPYKPPPPLTMGRFVPKDGLTVYLGGAGMEGEYITSQVEKLVSVGINGAVSGKLTEGLHTDAIAVLKYRYPARSISGLSATGPYTISTDWSLKALGVNRQLPQNGQFNLVGYSWGSLAAAQTALFYAEKGQIIDHLVLIGSPISQDFVNELRAANNIKRILIIDLTEKNDRIYAGMSDAELLASLPSLGQQMIDSQTSGSGQGHFFYGIAGGEGEIRRRQLAQRLRIEGLQ